MVKDKFKGNALVEFVLAVPVFFYLVLGVVDLSTMLVRQVVLQKTCFDLLELLSSSSKKDETDLQNQAFNFLKSKNLLGVVPSLQFKSLPTLPSVDVFRRKKTVQLISLTLNQRIEPHFPLMKSISQNVPLHLKAWSEGVWVKREEL